MEKVIQISFRARYYQSGEIKPGKRVWVVLHGYGQLAQYFIQKFKVLEEQNIVVIAPEGLSRFYLEDINKRVAGGSSRVGATWMTRENRETDIANYLTFLDAVYDDVQQEAGSTPITLLGFSQGAATASRWLAHRQMAIDQLILWAGVFPLDMNFDEAGHILRNTRVLWVAGRQDPFLTDDKREEMNQLCKKLGLTPQLLMFDGGHEIDKPTLLSIASS